MQCNSCGLLLQGYHFARHTWKCLGSKSPRSGNTLLVTCILGWTTFGFPQCGETLSSTSQNSFRDIKRTTANPSPTIITITTLLFHHARVNEAWRKGCLPPFLTPLFLRKSPDSGLDVNGAPSSVTCPRLVASWNSMNFKT